jgi:hypothetical protein
MKLMKIFSAYRPWELESSVNSWMQQQGQATRIESMQYSTNTVSDSTDYGTTYITEYTVAIFYTQDTSKMSFEDLKDAGDNLAALKSDEAFFRYMSEG